MAEGLCSLYRKCYGVKANVCRFYNVYGDRQISEGIYSTVIGKWIKQYKDNEPLTITGNGEQTRDFTHVDDIVEGLILTSESEEFDLDYVELGRGNNYSINELAKMFGDDYPTEYIKERPGEARVTLCDISVAQKDIGYNPKVNLQDYIKEVSEKLRGSK